MLYDESVLPKFILEIKEFKELLEAEDLELIKLSEYIKKIEKEILISSTDDLIARHEKIFAIIPTNNILKDRVEFIKAKVSGIGTINNTFLKANALAYNCGEIKIIEDFVNYLIKIKFVSIYGIPSNLENFKASMREIMPAHLDVAYQFSYMTWKEHDDYNKTWSEWDNLNLTWEQYERYQG